MRRILWPKYRTAHYAIWRACERLNITPPGVKQCWEDNDPWTQALILAYSQIRLHEETVEVPER